MNLTKKTFFIISVSFFTLCMGLAFAQEGQAKLKSTLEKLSKETGNKHIKTDSGLYIIPIKAGNGPKPSSPSATVLAHYEGKLLNGKVFDSSFARGNPISFPLNRVIKGWTEGLQQIKKGGSAYLVIPPELGYGQRGAPGAIPPNAWLIFKVELVDTN